MKKLFRRMMKATWTAAGAIIGIAAMQYFYNEIISEYWSDFMVNSLTILSGAVVATLFMVIWEDRTKIVQNFKMIKDVSKNYKEFKEFVEMKNKEAH